MKHMVAGLVMVALGLWGMVAWWNIFALVVRGLVPFALLGMGLIALLAAYRRMELESREEEDVRDFEPRDMPRRKANGRDGYEREVYARDVETRVDGN